MALVNPLDLRDIFVNHFAGSLFIFVVVALLVIIIIAARFKMTIFLTTLFMMIFLGILFSDTVLKGVSEPIYLLVILIGAIILSTILNRLISK